MTRRTIAVITIGAGALFVVLGSLFPLYGNETILKYGPNGPLPEGERRVVALTGWEYVQEPMPDPSPSGTGFDFPVYGYALAFAAVLAAAGALLQFRSPLLAAIGRFGVLTGFGMVVGTLWTVLETLRTLFGANAGRSSADVVSRGFVGTGTWLVGGAAVALLVGVVLAQEWPARLPRPEGASVYQVGDDDDTPPFGIAIPVTELDVTEAGPVPPVAELPGTELRGAGLPGAVLSGSELSGAEPSGTEPSGADLSGAELPGARTAPDRSTGDGRHPTGGNPSTVE
ncbi:hypothetical protein AB0G02_16785 [Actinosynnema sp. NPDC023658]|uniref:pentapeptide repeat-containing protein n=1 Tax=Actinosynnema sp. NPDC023658 TaxID=3155465 RepID=UPI0033C75AB6